MSTGPFAVVAQKTTARSVLDTGSGWSIAFLRKVFSETL
jgi:hypothetical protein